MGLNPASFISVAIIFPLLGTLAVAGRFASRAKYGAGYQIDDWLCLPALALVIVVGALLIYGTVEKGLGVHSDINTPRYDNPQQVENHVNMITNFLNPIGSGLIRLSFLFLYRRMFRGRTFKVLNWIMIAVVIVWTIFITCFQIGTCAPGFTTIWNSGIDPNVDCKHGRAFLAMLALSGLLPDVVILITPFFCIWQLHMPNSKKRAISSVFVIGLFAIFAATVRMVAITERVSSKPYDPKNVLGLTNDHDWMGAIAIWDFWSYVEQGTGMVVCCLPTLKGLVWESKIFNKVLRRPWQSSKASVTSSEVHRITSDSVSSHGERKAAHRIIITNTVDQYWVEPSPV